MGESSTDPWNSRIVHTLTTISGSLLPSSVEQNSQERRGLETAHGPMHRSIHILVVEDEVFIAETLAEILAAEGYQVDVAGNGRLALEKIEAQRYDLILTDLHMPELDGVGLYLELERRKPDLLRRLIVMTATVGYQHYQRFLAQTQVPVLEKPFSLLALHALTHEVLSTVRLPVQTLRR